ncbi:phage tail protein [Bacillus pseudomycoides]|uniref:Phage tail protein n=2 Tax=Bacillus pseudomycoides TaxID=64104 RepID=A0A2B4NKA9_9BACI|nr:distal tail protein Dit [Bacillus pseudomycoides]PEM73264.1 phage tail protein [Bacillus pseudomycoides]PFW68034.1 phage tail protein [Bacillus pseudomycoides]PFW80014.1 phage tail protein [Bacillus pseudomycoides]PFZ59277.1 phage tail protein [Bacillus pseudomycoides]PGD26818.1 phage tail protein [Bacillus pseudomycoides]
MTSFKFNGIKKDYLFILMGFNRSAWAPIERDILTTPGRPGGYLLQTNTKVRVIEVPVILKASSQDDLQKKKEDLADWLIQDEPKELIFDDEPDRTYMALLDGETDLDELIFRGKGSIHFVCPMPYKLGEVKTSGLSIVGSDLKAVIPNKGTVESNPIVEIDVLNKSPFIDIWNGDDYFRLGYPTGPKTKLVAQEDRVIWDKMDNLGKWNPHNGPLGSLFEGAGAMEIAGSGHGFRPSTYGPVKENTWYGPILKQSLPPGGATDFKVDMRLSFDSLSYDRMGTIMLFLLDANDNIVAQLGMKDEYDTSSITKAYTVINDGPEEKTLIDDTGRTPGSFTDFRGHVMLTREGNTWTAYSALYKKGTYQDYETIIETWNDVNKSNFATTSIVTKVAIGIFKYGDYSPLDAIFIEDLKVYKKFSVPVDATPYIVDQGDTVVVDTERALVTVNGKDAINIKELFSEFPVVNRGENEIIVRPKNIGTAKVTYRERYR